MGYSPWGGKESDTTEQVHLLFLTTSKIIKLTLKDLFFFSFTMFLLVEDVFCTPKNSVKFKISF